jgi:hypothetical protein
VLDAGQRLQSLEQRAVERGARAVIGEPVAQLDLRRHDATGIEAGCQLRQGTEGLGGERRGGHQSERERQLPRHEQPSHPSHATTARGAARRLAHHVAHLDGRRAHGGHRSKHDRREQ